MSTFCHVETKQYLSSTFTPLDWGHNKLLYFYHFMQFNILYATMLLLKVLGVCVRVPPCFCLCICMCATMLIAQECMFHNTCILHIAMFALSTSPASKIHLMAPVQANTLTFRVCDGPMVCSYILEPAMMCSRTIILDSAVFRHTSHYTWCLCSHTLCCAHIPLSQ